MSSLATKLRALYQRREAEICSIWATGLGHHRSDPGRIVSAFRKYMGRFRGPVSRAIFERNLAGKLADPQFGADMNTLLAPGYEWTAGGNGADRVRAADLAPPRRAVERSIGDMSGSPFSPPASLAGAVSLFGGFASLPTKRMVPERRSRMREEETGGRRGTRKRTSRAPRPRLRRPPRCPPR